MGIFVDTSDFEQVKKYHEMGVLRGVTTNPTILLKENLSGGIPELRKKVEKIAQLVAPYPVSVEVTNNDPDRMRKQAVEFSKWAPNINVKIPIHGPEGELENLKIVRELEQEQNIRVNVTAMMSAQQCYLAACAGASFVSIFAGRVNDMGYDSRKEITKLRGLLDQFALKAQIIAASSREVVNIVEWLEAGAHIVTVVPVLLEKMIVHPYSLATVREFVANGKKIDLGQ